MKLCHIEWIQTYDKAKTKLDEIIEKEEIDERPWTPCTGSSNEKPSTMKIKRILKKLPCYLGLHKWSYTYPLNGFHTPEHRRSCPNCLKEQQCEINGLNGGMNKMWVDCTEKKTNTNTYGYDTIEQNLTQLSQYYNRNRRITGLTSIDNFLNEPQYISDAQTPEQLARHLRILGYSDAQTPEQLARHLRILGYPPNYIRQLENNRIDHNNRIRMNIIGTHSNFTIEHRSSESPGVSIQEPPNFMPSPNQLENTFAQSELRRNIQSNIREQEIITQLNRRNIQPNITQEQWEELGKIKRWTQTNNSISPTLKPTEPIRPTISNPITTIQLED